MSNSLWPHGLYSSWNSPGQNTGVGSHFLLRGSSQPRDQTQVSLCRQILYQLSHQGSPTVLCWFYQISTWFNYRFTYLIYPILYINISSHIHQIYISILILFLIYPNNFIQKSVATVTYIITHIHMLTEEELEAQERWREWGEGEGEVVQSCPTLCDPMDCSSLGSSLHGILQARILEWVAIPSIRGSSQPRDQTQVSHIVGRFFTVWATREAPKLNHTICIILCYSWSL